MPYNPTLQSHQQAQFWLQAVLDMFTALENCYNLFYAMTSF